MCKTVRERNVSQRGKEKLQRETFRKRKLRGKVQKEKDWIKRSSRASTNQRKKDHSIRRFPIEQKMTKPKEVEVLKEGIMDATRFSFLEDMIKTIKSRTKWGIVQPCDFQRMEAYFVISLYGLWCISFY